MAVPPPIYSRIHPSTQAPLLASSGLSCRSFPAGPTRLETMTTIIPWHRRAVVKHRTKHPQLLMMIPNLTAIFRYPILLLTFEVGQ
jgi:hypothetical protein